MREGGKEGWSKNEGEERGKGREGKEGEERGRERMNTLYSHRPVQIGRCFILIPKDSKAVEFETNVHIS